MFRIHYAAISCDVANVLILKTTNDSQGNPRQLVVALDNKGMVLTSIPVRFDWGGLDSANKEFAEYVRAHAVAITVPANEYKRFRNLQPAEWIWIETI